MALTVIIGPPAAGKTSYVRAHARPGDVVVDYDRIANALTYGDTDTHRHAQAVAKVAHRARRAAVREALRQSSRADVWIIHTQPDAGTLAEYQRHGARLVVLDPGREVVLARCAEQRSRQVHAAAERWYATQSDVASSDGHGSRSW